MEMELCYEFLTKFSHIFKALFISVVLKKFYIKNNDNGYIQMMLALYLQKENLFLMHQMNSHYQSLKCLISNNKSCLLLQVNFIQ